MFVIGFDLSSLEFAILALNYIVLAGIFIYRYFNPKEWAGWLVESSMSYSFIYMLTMFVLIMSLALTKSFCWFPVVLGFLLLYLAIIKNEFDALGAGSVLPFVLYALTMGQEMYHVITSSIEDAPQYLILWYFLGIFVILIASRLIGRILDVLFPSLSKEHLRVIKEKFGPKAPRKLKFKDGSTVQGYSSPSEFAAAGVVYSLWMIVRYLLPVYFI